MNMSSKNILRKRVVNLSKKRKFTHEIGKFLSIAKSTFIDIIKNIDVVLDFMTYLEVENR